MEKHFKYCILCRRTITESELARELHVEVEDGIICATCAQLNDEATESAGPEEKPATGQTAPLQPLKTVSADREKHHQHFTTIQDHLERIHRVLIFEKSSPWNVLGAVSQCLAIGILLTAAFRWLQSPQDLLIVALIFQVMALTFFFKGK